MFKWTSFPFIRFSLFLIIGIVLYEQFPIFWQYPLPAFLGLVFFFLIAHILSTCFSFYQFRLSNGIAALLLVAWLSGYLTKIRDFSADGMHYSQYSNIEAFKCEVRSGVLEKEKYFRFDVDIKQILTDEEVTKVTGLAHLYLKKPVAELPTYGDNILVSAGLSSIPAPMNPGEFDYKKYMARKGVHSQVFVDPGSFKILGSSNGLSAMGISLRIRENVRGQLEDYFLNIGERQIAMALIVGIKDYLDQDIKKAYAAAGATHVLAVSGLHVGILYLFMGFFTKRLRKARYGHVLFAVLNLMAIWLYAMVTGLSPSVFRASIMFSVLVLADTIGRDRNIFNSLGIAAFILLLIDPYSVFEVGFQLSFLAVLGIVYLFPIIYNRLYFSNPMLDKLWGLTCVSIAAQISTAPLSLFYFHQFPTYFLLSNLVVIPASFVILIAGLPMVILGSLWSVIGKAIGFLLSFWIRALNFLIAQIQVLPISKLDWIYIEAWDVLALYGSIFFLIWSLQYRRMGAFISSGICWVILFASFAFRSVNTKENQELIVYEIPDASAVDILDGDRSVLMIDEVPDNLQLLMFQIDPYRLSRGYNSLGKDWTLQNEIMECDKFYCLMKIGDLKLVQLREDFHDFEPKRIVSMDVLLVSNDALSISQMNSFSFSYLIFDSSNSMKYLRKMRRKLKELGQGAHFVPFDGAWRLNLHSTSKDNSTDTT